MLIGFALLAVGAALLGYVVIARQPEATAPRPKSLAPSARSVPPAVRLEDTSDNDETLVMRVRSSSSDAVLGPSSEPRPLSMPPVEFAVPRPDPKVVLAYEDDAQEEEGTSPQV